MPAMSGVEPCGWLALALAALLLAACASAPAPAVQADAAWHRFPKGALAGNFLHELLQWLAEEAAGAGG